MGTTAHDARLQEILRHIGSGDDLIARGRPTEALKAFQAALAIKPADAKILNKIGLAHRQLGDNAAAIAAYSSAVSLDPASVVAHMNLGVLYDSLGDYGRAVASYTWALESRPGNIEVLRCLASDLSQLGRIGEALGAARKILAIDPEDVEAHDKVARLIPHPDEDDDTRAMAAAYARSAPGGESRKFLAFALGKVLEDQQRYGEAIRYFLESNAIHRASYDYDIQTDRARFAGLKATLDAGLFARLAGGGHHDPTLIFIVGMPRSGTSLVEQILASHPRVHGAGELPTFAESAKGIDAASVTPERLEQIGREYVARVRSLAPQAPFITDKMPHNFLYVGLIRLALPDAKIIHIRRDPVDNCLSIFKTSFARGHPYAYDLAELGRYHNLYRDLMAHWHQMLPGMIYDCDYEQLVHNQEAETRALLAHCGLEWNNACLNFHKTSRKVKTASIGQVHRQIYSSSVDLSRRYGDALAPLFEALNEGMGDERA
ncbi:MAG: sulfotransferase [Devosia sp.]